MYKMEAMTKYNNCPKIVRVFPRRTDFTPVDDLAFVGPPPMFRPPADEVHISVAFTWDMKEAEYLRQSWKQYYPMVKVGGPAFDAVPDGFVPGRYVKEGVTFTSRGCNNKCPWCLVWKREGKLKEIKNFAPGHIIQDNNLFQCSRRHMDNVFSMLRKFKRIQFTGGLDARLLTDSMAESMRSLSIDQMFFACDTPAGVKVLKKARKKLPSFTRHHLRCYVLCAYNGQTINQALETLEAVWEAGFVPFAQLYQPPDEWIEYSKEWMDLHRNWSRPALTRAMHKEKIPVPC